MIFPGKLTHYLYGSGFSDTHPQLTARQINIDILSGLTVALALVLYQALSLKKRIFNN